MCGERGVVVVGLSKEGHGGCGLHATTAGVLHGLCGGHQHLVWVLVVVRVQQQLVGQTSERREGGHEWAIRIAEGVRQPTRLCGRNSSGHRSTQQTG